MLDAGPLVPVPVVAAKPNVQQENPAAILPSKAVKLREKPVRKDSPANRRRSRPGARID